MKFCHVVPSLQEQHGGPSKSVPALCRALARAGHAVELLTTAVQVEGDSREESVSGHLRIRTFRRNRPFALAVSGGLAGALAATEADVVHHHALWLRTLHYAHRAANRRRVPLVISARGMMTPWAWHHHRWRKQVSRRLVHPGAFEAAAGWHATSAEEAADIRALGFAQPVCVAPNGVEAVSAQAIAEAAEHWGHACPEVRSRPTAVFYGRFHQKKRVLELIDTWLEHAPREWLLLLVGLPEQYTPAMLDQYVQRMSASGRIRAFSGSGRPPPYAVASLFLLPSHTENFGLAVAEALAHGVPALVTDTTPWSGLNEDERGWCVPWAEYPAAIRRATGESEARLRERGCRAREWALREFSWDAAAHRLVEFYATLTSPVR